MAADKVGTGAKHIYICATCGEQFKSYNRSPQYCSNTCKSEAQSVKLDTCAIHRLYWHSGMTQREIADHFGVSQKAVHKTMQRHGMSTRRAIPRNQEGANNPVWKGGDVGYDGAHDRVKRMRGKPNVCEVCGTTDPNASYEWANLTGDYANPGDYSRMCRSCHSKHDDIILNITHMRGR